MRITSAADTAIAPAVTIPGSHSQMPSANTENSSRQFIAVVFPAPAGPTSTSTTRPETAIAARAAA